MATFTYTGKTRSGEVVSGERVAEDMDAAVAALRREQVILQTRAAVEGGAALADAMRRYPKTFDTLFTNMIAAGEAGGILDTILKRLATYIEKAVKLKGQVKSAMIYPIAVIVIAAAVVGVILWKVIPTFAAMFEGLGASLPLPTRVVIALSDNLVRF